VNLVGPVGTATNNLHPMLQTARIPLGDFQADLTQVRGVRVTFDVTASGAIHLADIRMSPIGAVTAAAPTMLSSLQESGSTSTPNNDTNTITAVRTVPSALGGAGRSGG
jgi:hypothetical protein